MRLCVIGVLLAALAGCDMRGAGPTQAERRAPEEAKIKLAQKRFTAFLAEAEKGLDLLGKHPNHEALKNEVNKLHELLNEAGDAAPTDGKMGELSDEGRQLLRFFDACLKTADNQTRRNVNSPEKAQKGIDWVCSQNAEPIRQMIEQLRAKNEDAGAKKAQ